MPYHSGRGADRAYRRAGFGRTRAGRPAAPRSGIPYGRRLVWAHQFGRKPYAATTVGLEQSAFLVCQDNSGSIRDGGGSVPGQIDRLVLPPRQATQAPAAKLSTV